MKINLEDTITAISTPAGEGGIGIVRLSGPEAVSIVSSIFRSKDGSRDINKAESFTLHYGHIIKPNQTFGAAGEVIDEALVTVMRAPRTYTRQDVVEINCHGGIVPLKKIMDLTLRCGARLAGPGEFTQRAFLNGRIDLCQAEAVLDVIRAQTDEALSAAVSQLKGGLSDEVHGIRDRLLDIQARIEAAVDFPEDDIETYAEEGLAAKIEGVRSELKRLLETSRAGMILRQGVRAVIVGRPNVGKSSLMNAILKQDRVIVTPVPGTTRDAIEETADIKGIPVRLIDTAGLRAAGDEVEREGVARAWFYLGRADLVLLVFDAGEELNREDLYIVDEVKKRRKKTIVILNKIDRPVKLTIEQVKEIFEGAPVVGTSAVQMKGITEIEDAISGLFWQGRINAGDGVLLSNLRHKEAMEKALENIISAHEGIKRKISPEFVALDIKEALDGLGMIVGRTTTEDLLERIFSKFCIGK